MAGIVSNYGLIGYNNTPLGNRTSTSVSQPLKEGFAANESGQAEIKGADLAMRVHAPTSKGQITSANMTTAAPAIGAGQTPEPLGCPLQNPSANLVSNGTSSANCYFAPSSGNLNMFYESNPNESQGGSPSTLTDGLNHLTGYSLLNSSEAGYVKKSSAEAECFHEGFGELVGYASALLDPSVRAKVALQTGGDLSLPNFASSSAGLDGRPTNPWTSSFAEIVKGICDQKKGEGLDNPSAIHEAANEAFSLWSRAMAQAPLGEFNSRGMANAIMSSSHKIKEGKYNPVVGQVLSKNFEIDPSA